MPDWLEFHDSTLTHVAATETHVEIVLDAHVQRWQTVDAAWRGTGWLQEVRIVVSGVSARPAVPPLPTEVWDGNLTVGAEALGLVAVPFRASDARYLEDLPADAQPDGLL